MFKPTAEHMEELLRAKEICDSLIDDVSEKGLCVEVTWLNAARINIEYVLEKFYDTMKALPS